MKGVKITPDLIIAVGMSTALILAICFGASPEVTIGIAGGLSGYLGQVISSDDTKPSRKEKEREIRRGEHDEGRAENY